MPPNTDRRIGGLVMSTKGYRPKEETYGLCRLPAIALLIGALLSACCAYNARLSKQHPSAGQNVNSAQTGLNRATIRTYEGFWNADDSMETELAGYVFKSGTTLILHVAEDGQSGTIDFMIIRHPYDSTIALSGGHWIMDGPDKAVLQFDEEGWENRGIDTLLFQDDRGNSGDGTLLFRDKKIIVVTRYAENGLFKFSFGCVFRQAELTGP